VTRTADILIHSRLKALAVNLSWHVVYITKYKIDYHGRYDQQLVMTSEGSICACSKGNGL